MPAAFVGETRVPKNFKRYARQFSLLEIDCEPGNVPGRGRLEACAAAAPPEFVFSLVVPSRLASLETGPEFDRALKSAQNVARLLRGKWWVVRTPAEVRPTRRSREGLAALVSRLSEGGMRVAWEPRGVWDEAAAGETADAIGAVLVQDIAREVPRSGRVLYSRLLAFGKRGRVGLSLADRVAERMRGFEEAFVVVEGQGAREIQQALGIASEEGELDESLDLGRFGASAGAAGAAAAAAGLAERAGAPEEDEDALEEEDLDEEDEDDLDDDLDEDELDEDDLDEDDVDQDDLDEDDLDEDEPS